MQAGEVVACDLQVESYFGGENSSVEGTVTLQDGRVLTVAATGSASDRGTWYELNEEGAEKETFWWDEVEWLDEWITNSWPENPEDFDAFKATLKFGPDLPWTETIEEVPDEDE